MERKVTHSPANHQEPISGGEWEELRASIESSGGKVIQMGLLDDEDPNGGADTACQRNLEEAAGLGKIITVFTEKAHGIRELKTFRIINTP